MATFHIYHQHQQQMLAFQKLQKKLPSLEIALAEKHVALREVQDCIRIQRASASVQKKTHKTLRELRRRKDVRMWYDENCDKPQLPSTKHLPEDVYKLLTATHTKWFVARDYVTKYRDSYQKASEIETQIKKLNRTIHNIASRKDETNYILSTFDVLHEYSRVDYAERQGMYDIIFEEHTQYPPEHRHYYKGTITENINVTFVSGENRETFSGTNGVQAQTTASQLKQLYRFKLRALCDDEDPVTEQLITQKGKVYLTKYHLLFPENNDKTLDDIVRFYGIPLHDDEPLTVYVQLPVDGAAKSSSPIGNKRLKHTNYHQNSRRNLYDTYQECIGLQPKNKSRPSALPKCKCGYTGELCAQQKAGDIVCPACATVVAESTIPAGLKGVPFNHPVEIIRNSEYKPIMHLNDILKQRQAIESTNVPQEVLEAVNAERKKFRMKKSQLNAKRTREYLQKLKRDYPNGEFKYSKYYENIPQIILRLGGAEPVRYSPEQEKAIRSYFLKIIEPFTILCPKQGKNKRRNLLSYNYLLRQICTLLSYHAAQREDLQEEQFWYEQSTTFNTLKDRSKMVFYDQLWTQMMDLIGEPAFAVA